MGKPNARGYAADLLHQVAYLGRSLDRVLSDAGPLERDRSLVHEITIGSVRHFYSLSDEVNSRLTTPLKARDAIVFCLLLVGAYQLRHTRIPSYASVNETVNATRQIGRPWARGLVNQILRRIALEPPPSTTSIEAKLDHPTWLIESVREDYPDTWEAILKVSLTRAPLSLRVNATVMNRDAYQELLMERGVSAHLGAPSENLVLDTPVSAVELPGLTVGWVSVQDSGAMWAAPLLAGAPGQRVLAACAAPGGKAMHLIERYPGIELVALDVDSDRCELVRAECRRFGLDPGLVVHGDGTRLDWWDGTPFQRILLDAPCSGTGTLRRHPDIKLLKRESDLQQYYDLQSRLLANLWQALDIGGRLLYCTCSILSRENDRVVERFVSQTLDASFRTIAADWGISTRFGRQLLPTDGGSDGFYYAILEKRSPQ